MDEKRLSRLRLELGTVLDSACSYIGQVSREMKRIDSVKMVLSMKRDKARASIEDCMLKIQTQLATLNQAILMELSEEIRTRDTQLRETKKQMMNHIRKTAKQCARIEDLLEIGKEHDLAAHGEKVLEDIITVISLNPDSAGMGLTDLDFVPNDDKILSILVDPSVFGYLQCTSINPEAVELHLVEESNRLLVHKDAVLTIITELADQTPPIKQHLSVSLLLPDRQVQQLEIDEPVDGTHTVSFAPTNLGPHSLHVLLYGTHVHDSPMPLYVYSSSHQLESELSASESELSEVPTQSVRICRNALNVVSRHIGSNEPVQIKQARPATDVSLHPFSIKKDRSGSRSNKRLFHDEIDVEGYVKEVGGGDDFMATPLDKQEACTAEETRSEKGKRGPEKYNYPRHNSGESTNHRHYSYPDRYSQPSRADLCSNWRVAAGEAEKKYSVMTPRPAEVCQRSLLSPTESSRTVPHLDDWESEITKIENGMSVCKLAPNKPAMSVTEQHQGLNEQSKSCVALSKSFDDAAKLCSPVALASKTFSPIAMVTKISSPVAMGTNTSSPATSVTKLCSPVSMAAKTCFSINSIAKLCFPDAMDTKPCSTVAMDIKTCSPLTMATNICSPVAMVTNSSSPVAMATKISSPFAMNAKPSSTVTSATKLCSPNTSSPVAMDMKISSPFAMNTKPSSATKLCSSNTSSPVAMAAKISSPFAMNTKPSSTVTSATKLCSSNTSSPVAMAAKISSPFAMNTKPSSTVTSATKLCSSNTSSPVAMAAKISSPFAMNTKPSSTVTSATKLCSPISLTTNSPINSTKCSSPPVSVAVTLHSKSQDKEEMWEFDDSNNKKQTKCCSVTSGTFPKKLISKSPMQENSDQSLSDKKKDDLRWNRCKGPDTLHFPGTRVTNVILQNLHTNKGILRMHLRSQFGKYGSGSQQMLKFPIGVTVSKHRDIIVCDNGNSLVKVFSWDGTHRFSIGDLGGKTFTRPSAVVTTETEIFVKDDKQIQAFDNKGRFMRAFGKGVLTRPYGLALTDNGFLVTLDENRHRPRVVIFAQDGTVVSESLFEPLLQDSQGRRAKCRFLTLHNNKLYVVDLGQSLVYVTDLQGRTQLVFGGYGDQPGHFREPSGISADKFGNLMIADSRNNRLQLFGVDGSLRCVVQLDCNITRPSDIHLTDDGNLLVVNYILHVVKTFAVSN